MAKLLHEEVISDEALSCVMSTRGSVSDSRAVLLKAVRDAVHSNYKHLELFVTVLRKFSETAHIGDTISEQYSKLIQLIFLILTITTIEYNFSTDENVEEMEMYLTESTFNFAVFKLYTCFNLERGSQYASSDLECKNTHFDFKIHYFILLKLKTWLFLVIGYRFLVK